MPVYSDDDMLMLSGIQHFMFCPRQWALIHLEQQWADNRLTAEGEVLHKNVDNPFYRQKNGNVITLRSVHIASSILGLYGMTDAIELSPADDSDEDVILHPDYPGLWHVLPVEYKRGIPKHNEVDEVQLAAQCICLEEIYGIKIRQGALFYWEQRSRELISINDSLRSLTAKIAEQMHKVFSSGRTPVCDKKPHCKNCSLKDLCLIELTERGSVKSYLKSGLYEETT